MTQEEILSLFRQQAADMQQDAPSQTELIMELSALLADSRGRFSKETFEKLVLIGAALYKVGQDHFDARQNVSDIMQRSADEHGKPD